MARAPRSRSSVQVAVRKDGAPEIRDRIAGLLRLPKSRLRPNPRNWRLHPEQQRKVLRALLGDVGVVDAVLVRPVESEALQALRALRRGDDSAFHTWAKAYDGAFMLFDGHMRLEEIPGDEVPALVVDLDEREETEVLATFDPIAAMAKADRELLRDLSVDLEGASELIVDLVDDLMGGSDDPGAGAIEVVDTTRLDEEFYISARGPLPAQPEAISRLRQALSDIPGVIVEVGLVG